MKTAKCYEMKENVLIVSTEKVKLQIQPSLLIRRITRIVRKFQVPSYVSMWDSQPVNKIDLDLLIAQTNNKTNFWITPTIQKMFLPAH